MDNQLGDYYEALQRLVDNKPEIVDKGVKISLKSVALEAGKSAGAIKKSRNIYAPLLKDINDAIEKKRSKQSESDVKIANLRNEVAKYKALYEASLAREVVISSQLLDYTSAMKK